MSGIPATYVLMRAGRPHTFWNPTDRPATYATVMSQAGVEKYLADLASGLRRVATGEDAAALREHLSEAYDIAVVGTTAARVRRGRVGSAGGACASRGDELRVADAGHA